MWKHSDSASDENAQAEVNNNLLMAKPGRLFTPQLPDLSVVLNYWTLTLYIALRNAWPQTVSSSTSLSLYVPFSPLYELPFLCPYQFADKGLYSQSCGFSSSRVWM